MNREEVEKHVADAYGEPLRDAVHDFFNELMSDVRCSTSIADAAKTLIRTTIDAAIGRFNEYTHAQQSVPDDSPRCRDCGKAVPAGPLQERGAWLYAPVGRVWLCPECAKATDPCDRCGAQVSDADARQDWIAPGWKRRLCPECAVLAPKIGSDQDYKKKYLKIVERCRTTSGRCFCGVHLSETMAEPSAPPVPDEMTRADFEREAEMRDADPGDIESPAPKTERRVTVAGDTLLTSLADHVRGCEVFMAEEQEKIAPDTALIGLLCNSVRLARENERMARRGLEEIASVTQDERYGLVKLLDIEASHNGPAWGRTADAALAFLTARGWRKPGESEWTVAIKECEYRMENCEDMTPRCAVEMVKAMLIHKRKEAK